MDKQRSPSFPSVIESTLAQMGGGGHDFEPAKAKLAG